MANSKHIKVGISVDELACSYVSDYAVFFVCLVREAVREDGGRELDAICGF